ncbi:MAG: tRNA (adenosine(37)-N6)-threonylcarbamoyltransferase complex ATPase subunit type 1 TsaE [Rickettsiales bacterium]|nr:tRNA (adenosine(37)-N6)-threonylcarbamoyltransferase complex ATPase subunit type 1 TsaE [Rickettsiales bacterium]
MSVIKTSIIADGESVTQAIAAALAQQCKLGDCLLLEGDLGAGKTAFARGFIKQLCPTEEVVSPTFNLVQHYRTLAQLPIYHYDLYRLRHAQELMELGLDEALTEGITLIEWPQLARPYLPPEALTIQIRSASQPQERYIDLIASDNWQLRLASVIPLFQDEAHAKRAN